MDKNEPSQKILVVRRGAIGDVLMITPFIKGLHEVFHNSNIDVLTHPKSLIVLQNNPSINEILTISHTNSISFWEHKEITNYISKQKYDLAFILETKKFYSELVKKGKVKTVIGLSSASDYYYPLHPHKHVIESYLDLIEHFFGKTNLQSKMEVFPSDAQKKRVNDLLNLEKQHESHKVIVIHPGTSAVKNIFIKNKYGLRFWGLEKFAQLADWFNSHKNLKVIFTGSKQEDRLIREIMALMKTEGLNFSGSLSLLELAALISKADLFISGDTGPLHIATAVGTPVTAIFGPSLWEQTGPFASDDKKLLIRKSTPCSPCWGTERRKRCKKNLCLQDLTYEEVRDAIMNKYGNRLGWQLC